MRHTVRWRAIGATLLLAAVAAAQDTRPVATFEGGVVTAADVAAMAEPALIRARQALYDAQAEAARELAFRRLLEREARAAGVTWKELLESKLAARLVEPDTKEVESLLARHRAQLPADGGAARSVVVEALRRRNRRAARRSLRAEMLAAAGFRLALEPPRVEVPVDPGDPARGPADAPVTIVEFADFQCPFCARVQATLAELERRYPGKLRLVHKDLPLGMHPFARQAAQAAACAGEQGKFWELGEWMYANQGKLSEAGLAEGARAVGLDPERFAACRKAHRHAGEIAADEAAASALGVGSTPTFFINGRLLEGAQPLERFVEVIEEELRRAGEAPAAARDEAPMKPPTGASVGGAGRGGGAGPGER